jgi:hypothetical protein
MAIHIFNGFTCNARWPCSARFYGRISARIAMWTFWFRSNPAGGWAS